MYFLLCEVSTPSKSGSVISHILWSVFIGLTHISNQKFSLLSVNLNKLISSCSDFSLSWFHFTLRFLKTHLLCLEVVYTTVSKAYLSFDDVCLL